MRMTLLSTVHTRGGGGEEVALSGFALDEALIGRRHTRPNTVRALHDLTLCHAYLILRVYYMIIVLY